MNTSREELKERVTWDLRVTTFPKLMGCLNEMLSAEAVTTILLECFWAAMAATISIQCIRRPPMRLLRVLVSLGRTISVMMVTDSFANFCFAIKLILSKNRNKIWFRSNQKNLFRILFCELLDGNLVCNNGFHTNLKSAIQNPKSTRLISSPLSPKAVQKQIRQIPPSGFLLLIF